MVPAIAIFHLAWRLYFSCELALVLMTIRQSQRSQFRYLTPTDLKHVDVVALPLGSHGTHADNFDPNHRFSVDRRL